MVQTQSLTMLGYVGSPCADNRLASSFYCLAPDFFHSMFSGQYTSKFALSGLPIVKVGTNFDPERRTIGDWKIEG